MGCFLLAVAVLVTGSTAIVKLIVDLKSPILVLYITLISVKSPAAFLV